MKPDVVCCGEVLVDWIAAAPSLDEACTFTRAFGGAPANVAIGIARLGARASFMGGLAPDPFGAWLQQMLAAEGVDLRGAVVLPDTQTRMAYITTDAEGDRSLAAFSTMRCADALFDVPHVDGSLLKDCRIFHFGTVTLSHATSKAATLHAAHVAKEHGALISCDPNLRRPLWAGDALARDAITQALHLANIAKLNAEEAAFMTGHNDPYKAADALMARFAFDLLAVTLGGDGAVFRTRADGGHVPAPRVDAVDTTGAGDAFTAALLAGALRHDLDRALDIVQSACQAGTAACTHVGAVTKPASLR